jgi:hypothetical protein
MVEVVWVPSYEPVQLAIHILIVLAVKPQGYLAHRKTLNPQDHHRALGIGLL